MRSRVTGDTDSSPTGEVAMALSSAPPAPGKPSAVRPLTRRDRALLAAVAAGRAQLTVGKFPRLLVDNRGVCDQIAVWQLLARQLITAAVTGPGELARAVLTPAGWAALRAVAVEG